MTHIILRIVAFGQTYENWVIAVSISRVIKMICTVQRMHTLNATVKVWLVQTF